MGAAWVSQSKDGVCSSSSAIENLHHEAAATTNYYNGHEIFNIINQYSEFNK